MPRIASESIEASAPPGLRPSSTPSVETAAGAASRRFALGVQPALKPSSLRRAALFIGGGLVFGTVVTPTLNIKAECALEDDVGETDEKRPKRAKKAPDRLGSKVDTRPQPRPLRTDVGLAITEQDAVRQFGTRYALASDNNVRETQQHARPVRLDAPAVEILLVGAESSRAISVQPFEYMADVVRMMVEDLGALYAPGETSYRIPDCQDVGGVLLAPPYVQGCRPGVLDDLRSSVRPGGIELCVCLQKGVLAMMHVLDDAKALTTMHDDLCKIHGAAFRRNFCEVEITTALFDLRKPLDVNEIPRDSAQGQLNALKALESVAEMRLVVCSLETVNPEGRSSTASEFEKAAADRSLGMTRAFRIEGGFDMGGQQLLLVPGGSNHLPMLLRSKTRHAFETNSVAQTVDELRKCIVRSVYPHDPIVGSAPVWKSTSELGYRADARPRGQRRVDDKGCPKYDFHTGPLKETTAWTVVLMDACRRTRLCGPTRITKTPRPRF